MHQDGFQNRPTSLASGTCFSSTEANPGCSTFGDKTYSYNGGDRALSFCHMDTIFQRLGPSCHFLFNGPDSKQQGCSAAWTQLGLCIPRRPDPPPPRDHLAPTASSPPCLPQTHRPKSARSRGKQAPTCSNLLETLNSMLKHAVG